MQKNTFDEVVSLGYNCEVSFRIKDYFGKISSYPYSWAYCCDKNLFLKSLDNLDDILTGEITLLPLSGMFKCEKYNMNFHSSKHKENLVVDGKPNKENVEKEIKNLKEKIKHLTKKFKDLLTSEKNTLFVIKIKHDEFNDEKFIQEIYSRLLKYYKSKRFLLLVVLEEKYLTKEIINLESERLKIRTVKYFAKDNDTLRGGDLVGWNSVFSEFKVKFTMIIFINKLKRILKRTIDIQ
ncbi:hypothetical protein QTI12_14785 [Clostridium perfringens]|nr:hypothetical protein [Clostridium perfringens]